VDLEKGTSQHKTENQIINEKIRGMRKWQWLQEKISLKAHLI
jgi:hypothetical protein